MGRYYNGDIEGKFWFAVQSSDDASFFGGNAYEPNYINYEFDEDDIESLELGLQKCKDAMGDKKEELDKFFDDNNGYNDEMLVDAGICTLAEAKNLLQWYARFYLGEKIYNCVKEKSYCNFEAEC